MLREARCSWNCPMRNPGYVMLRPMSMRQRCVLLTLFPLMVVTACSQEHRIDSVRSPASSQSAAPIVIDSEISETFTPAPAGTSSTLTAGEAFRRFSAKASSKATSRGDGFTETLGFLTLPTGRQGEFTADNQLVWAYEGPSSCAMSTGPSPAAETNHLPQSTCQPTHQWLFLDAGTGEDVDSTYQR